MEQRGPEAAGMPVADILGVVAATMQQERGRLNALSSFSGDGTHGDRMVRAFTDAAGAVLGSGTGDAGEDLQLAGQVLADPAAGYGHAAQYFGQGFVAAGPPFYGRPGLALSDLGALLTGLLQGAQQDNPAGPGSGTLVDVLVPAATAGTMALQQGLTFQQAIQGVLGAAMSGVRRTANMPQPFNRHRKGKPTEAPGNPDPGAASAQTLLTGLIQGLLGDKVPPTPADQSSNNFLLNLLQQGIDLGGNITNPPPPSGVETLLGGTSQAGRYGQRLPAADPGYGQGTDITTGGRA